jgi:hypothetical protein
MSKMSSTNKVRGDFSFWRFGLLDCRLAFLVYRAHGPSGVDFIYQGGGVLCFGKVGWTYFEGHLSIKVSEYAC